MYNSRTYTVSTQTGYRKTIVFSHIIKIGYKVKIEKRQGDDKYSLIVEFCLQS